MKGRKNGKGHETQKKACCLFSLDNRENSDVIPVIQVVTLIGHAEHLGKGDSHELQASEHILI